MTTYWRILRGSRVPRAARWRAWRLIADGHAGKRPSLVALLIESGALEAVE